MLYRYQDIRTLQAEITSDCNARCPQCPRNQWGGATVSDLPITRWRQEDLPQMFDSEFVAQLEMVYLCGTYGDPMRHPQVLEIAAWFRSQNPRLRIGIHTNGGVGRTETYRELARVVDFVGFGIDGLADTNHLYRQGVQWHLLQAHTEAFIRAGGRAIWDFIAFRHNEHQVDEARQAAHRQGFAEFNVKRTARFLTRDHRAQAYQSVHDLSGTETHRIEPPTRPELCNPDARPLTEAELSTTRIHCNARRIREVYVSADHGVFPCGWLHDRLYGPEIRHTEDHHRMIEWMQSGPHNCLHHSLQECVEGAWFQRIAQSHSSPDRMSRCAHMCGTSVNPIGCQNSEIDYKS